MHSLTSPRQYNPSMPGNARRIKLEVWRKFQTKITMLHNQGCTKKEILAALERDTSTTQQNFHPTMGQLIGQMKAWGLTADTRGSDLASKEIDKIETPIITTRMIFEESRYAEGVATVNENQKWADVPNGSLAWSLQNDQLSIEERNTVNQPPPPDDNSGFDEPSSEVDADIMTASSRYLRDSFNPLTIGHEDTKVINWHCDVSSKSHFNDINDDNALRLSNVSSTSPLTVAEPSSMDDFSLEDGIFEVKAPRQLVGQRQSQPLISSDVASNQHPDGRGPITSILSDNVAIPCLLQDLWPGHLNPQTLTALQLGEMRGAAASLAAAGLFNDAFDLFHIEYRSWQACSGLISTSEAMRRLVTATINCARTCRSGRREEIARQLIRHTLEIMMKQGLGCSLESALLTLYLSNLLERKRSQSQELRDLQVPDPCMIVNCTESFFTIISSELQDREYLFMAEALKHPWIRVVDLINEGSLLPLLKTIEQKVGGPQHLTDCKEITAGIEILLLWCKKFIQKYSRRLSQVGKKLLRTADFRLNAPWLFYCCCVCELSTFGSGFRSGLATSKVQSCAHERRHLSLDTPLALAVITESFLTSGTDMTKWQFSGVQFSIYCLGEINKILDNMPMRCRDITEAYLSRISDLPQPPEGLNPLGGRSSELVRWYICAAVGARRTFPVGFTVLYGILSVAFSSSKVEFTVLPGRVSTAFPSQQLIRRSSPRNSMASSVKSSINTIRSSMSFDTKQMLELKLRLRRPNSILSIRSKDACSSNTRSTKSFQSDSFEKVTGMPSGDPVEDLLIERIDEETIDEEMFTGEMSDGGMIDGEMLEYWSNHPLLYGL